MPLHSYRHRPGLLALLALAGILVFVLGRQAIMADASAIGELTRRYEIPPTFGDDRGLYASVLSLMLTMAVLALGALIENVRFLFTNTSAWREPAKVTVFNETILLAAVLFSIVPDILVLLIWGEIMAPSGASLSKWDRVFDGIAALTFFAWIFRRIRARPSLLFQLQRDSIPVDLEPKWEQLRPKILIVLAVMVISFGVAFGK